MLWPCISFGVTPKSAFEGGDAKSASPFKLSVAMNEGE